MKMHLAVCAAALSFASASVFADDRGYTEGRVVNVAAIRTVDGHFDNYMKWVNTTWKAQEEAAKKAGYIESYQVLTAQPRGPEDADVYLIIYYKNFAALDGGMAKADAIAKQIEGSVAASNAAQADRSKIRRIIGSETMQEVVLK